MNINQTLAKELNLNINNIEAAIALLDEGATVPFISRYRKEVTGAMTDTELRNLVDRLEYLRELEDRRAVILKSITEQGKLTDELQKAIVEADNKTTLEDLYLPYKPRRTTKAMLAKEAGLEPLALALLNNPELNPETEAAAYINTEKNILDAKAALEGARHILMESFAEQAELISHLREFLTEKGVLTSKVLKDKETEGVKFKDYFEFSEEFRKIPSHRALALFRGRKLDILQLSLGFPDELGLEHCVNRIAAQFNIQRKERAADSWLWQTVEWTWKIKLYLKLEVELLSTLREHAEEEAIHVFKDNLKNLLMTAPAGNHVVLGLDPGFRTGVKVVVIDGTGKLLEYVTIFPHAPRDEWDASISKLAVLCKKHSVKLVSIGNGTASRETDKLVADLMAAHKDLHLTKVVVSEAGASVYSASQLGAEEFPDLDVTYRGAVSIARRLQDPLAELVKIDPKAIGVGQYQHDVNQIRLGRSLTDVLEDCVNAVGADVNTASVPLLATISGLNENVARSLVTYREANGRFNTREDIKKVPRLGPKTFEQAIGFLRIIGGPNPLDASSVHPESYAVVNQMVEKLKKPMDQIIGNSSVLSTIKPENFVTEQVGLLTIKDIITELNKPGRDPRPEFQAVTFKEGVETIADLKPDMILEGVISNVANFGAFVDIGVHQDGLVHISQVSNNYVTNIHDVVKVGQIVRVKVVEVDAARKRISLTMKLETRTEPSKPQATSPQNQPKPKAEMASAAPLSAMAEQLLRLRK